MEFEPQPAAKRYEQAAKITAHTAWKAREIRNVRIMAGLLFKESCWKKYPHVRQEMQALFVDKMLSEDSQGNYRHW